MPRWLLPENIADILPSEARRIEDLRRRLLDAYRLYGYELVMPPMLEYLESLLTGSGRDLDLKTFKLVDQRSGRTMGLRPDITPQVARIDAHLLDRSGIVRLCYAGSVLHASPSGPLSTRDPLQIGAELYGHSGLEADLEVIDLLLQSLCLTGVARVRVDLGHVAIVRSLFQQLVGLDEERLFECVQAKDAPGLSELLAAVPNAPAKHGLLALPRLFGPVDEVLARARALLPPLPEIVSALAQLESLAESLMVASREGMVVDWALDLADARGYRYHSGVMFAVCVEGFPSALGRGGRYDNVGVAFGRSRPATGFSLDLRDLASLLPDQAPRPAIRAPWAFDTHLAEAVRRLRSGGEIVVQVLPGHEHELHEFECDRELIRQGADWHVSPVRRS